MERYVVELHLALQLRRFPGAGQILDVALYFQNLSDAFVADIGLRVRIGHLRQFLHRLIHLSQIHDKENQRAGGESIVHDHSCAEPENQSGAASDDDFHQRGKFRFQAAGAQCDFNALETLVFKPLLLVVFARERFHDTNG